MAGQTVKGNIVDFYGCVGLQRYTTNTFLRFPQIFFFAAGSKKTKVKITSGAVSSEFFHHSLNVFHHQWLTFVLTLTGVQVVVRTDISPRPCTEASHPPLCQFPRRNTLLHCLNEVRARFHTKTRSISLLLNWLVVEEVYEYDKKVQVTKYSQTVPVGGGRDIHSLSKS